MSESKQSKALHREASQLRRELRDLSRSGLSSVAGALRILQADAIPEPTEPISRQRRRQRERAAAKAKRHS